MSRTAIALWFIGTLPFLSRLTTGRTSESLTIYLANARAALDGARVYADVPFEYPPYALAWFLGPAALAGDLAQFRIAFGLLIFSADAAIKAGLLWTGVRDRDRPPDFLPFAMYTLATAALGHILLQRYDVIPAALTVAALLALSRGWAVTAGVAIAIAAGTKVYPVLLVPVMVAFVWKRNGAVTRLLTGVAVGVLPLVAASFWAPWWRFASVHTGRGLEVESVWASAIWLAHFAGVPATWEVVRGWTEVTGPVAAWLSTPARNVWAGATMLSVVIAARAAGRARSDDQTDTTQLSMLAACALLPFTTFVALNLVLSPQFHLWLAPLAAIALMSRRSEQSSGLAGVRLASGAIFLSTFLVPAFFPSPTFDSGLDLGRTLVLVLRNVLLLYATWMLFRAVSRQSI
jgi:hypothetical protein